MKQPAVYLLASKPNGTLYIGVTSDLVKRIWEHRTDQAEGFTKKYQVHTLVYFELHEDMLSAITREKQLKKWNRALIEKHNPQWRDLWEAIVGQLPSGIPPARERHLQRFPRSRHSRAGGNPAFPTTDRARSTASFAGSKFTRSRSEPTSASSRGSITR
jgi:putative endonuclease